MDDTTRYSVNESLLQSYRSIFISSQSFLLAVGAIAVDKSTIILFATAIISLVMILWIWLPVVVSRHRIVDYYKFGADLPHDKRAALCTEKEYVHNRALRKEANATFRLRTNWRPTRLKLDVAIPGLFFLLWIALVIQQLVHSSA